MAEIRVFITSNAEGIEERVPSLLQHAQQVRKEPGCVQIEYFRGVEFPENFVQLELWDSPQSFDAHWNRPLEQVGLLADPKYLQSPFSLGTTDTPRRHGQNCIEFYERVTYANVGNYFLAEDTSKRIEAIRWPAWSAVRYIMQSNSDPNAPSQAQGYYDETRREFGCLQFDAYRSLEFPENALNLELWDSPEAIERHWIYRQVQRKYGVGSGPQGARVEPPARRYGTAGREWYPQCRYERAGDIWVPEKLAQRQSVIRWT